jgi:hypothetical protein
MVTLRPADEDAIDTYRHWTSMVDLRTFVDALNTDADAASADLAGDTL